jgi:TonB family protein
MSYRTIALASCLVMVGCGGAPPRSAAAPGPPGDSVAAAPPPPPTVTGKVEVGEGGKKDSPTPTPSTTSPTDAPSRAAGPSPGSAAPDKGITQAVVETREPLGGKLTQDDIRRILDKNGDVFGDCYTLGAGGKLKNFKGVVTVKATIGPKGAINQVDVIKSTANNPKVDACVRESFKKIKFPPPHDGATTVVTFPINFNGVEQVQ